MGAAIVAREEPTWRRTVAQTPDLGQSQRRNCTRVTAESCASLQYGTNYGQEMEVGGTGVNGLKTTWEMRESLSSPVFLSLRSCYFSNRDYVQIVDAS
jgi:hypothetical protein